jgi:uncharacterized membrane protein AbrB (regulator of aidB expression)
MHPYWFKPKRFWKVFAAYYPVSWQGFLVTVVTLLVALALCVVVVSPLIYLLALMILGFIFDLICVRTGEYPSWWKKRG